MRFKTTINITTEAKDKNEAMDIAGEYLSGNLMTGIDMKLRTTSVSTNRKITVAALAFFAISGTLIANMAHTRQQSKMFSYDISADYAVQAPLKTSAVYREYTDFKQEWQMRHSAEVLGSIPK